MASDAATFAARGRRSAARRRLALLGAVALVAGGGVWLVRGPLRRPAARAAASPVGAAVGNGPPRPAAGGRADAADVPPAPAEAAAARSG